MITVKSISPAFSESEFESTYNSFVPLIEETRQSISNLPFTGWLRNEFFSDETNITRIENKALEIRNNADVFVLIGVGGSNNSARAVIEALSLGNHSPEIIYAGNSTDPHAIDQIMRHIAGKSVYIDIIAKNFETLEPGIAFRVLRKYLYDTYGDAAAGRITATGTPGSHLHYLCLKNNWDFFIFPEDVGGRYSAFTDVALLPLAVAGVNIREYLTGAFEAKEVLLNPAAADNPALMYAVMRTLLYRRGFTMEVLSSFKPQLANFYHWWIQLFAESEGKNKLGTFPVTAMFSEELHSLGQFLQDGTPNITETFLVPEEDASFLFPSDTVDDGFSYLDGKDFRDINAAALAATIEAHSSAMPCTMISTGKISARMFGELFMFFMIACVFSCKITGADPFNQPGVEDYKKSMFKLLGKVR